MVYSKPPFAGPAKLLDYLSRYTHRVAISNHRLVDCAESQVIFRDRDRADGDRRTEAKLPASEFIGRFLTHVLPTRFMRIRHYAFLANRHKSAKLAKIRQLLATAAPPSSRYNTQHVNRRSSAASFNYVLSLIAARRGDKTLFVR